ncbi:ORF6N domain-containing protein [Pseudobacillus badius]|uniref:ORF6N domain-containing protein n=1 Tax=Bacillus badius TaxID=1455 RepID=UPI0007B344C3|nr:ORF6N domain-containing protein [Bacillus badius]KZR58335.1 antirepressor [Bacillus badius]
MSNLTVIEREGQRVLTTAQLAEAYGSDARRISENFNANKDRYKAGKHFIILEGDNLKIFKREYGNSVVASTVNRLYLWTEKGAWLHAKSLNTDAAWNAYEMLVDDYFEKQQQVRVLSEREQLMASMKLSLEAAEEIAGVKEEVREIKQQMSEELTLNHGQQTALQHEIKRRIESIKNDYDVSKQKLYSQIHSHLRRAFAAPKYIFVKRKDYEEAVRWVKSWRPLL